MTRHRITLLLALLSLLLTGSLLVPGRVPALAFAFGAVAFPVGLIVLGALAPPRGGRPGGLGARLAGALLALLVILELSAGVVLALSSGPSGAGRTVAGMPVEVLAAVAQVAGLWLLPLPLVALAYALTFDRSGVTPEALASLREHSRRRGGAPPPGS